MPPILPVLKVVGTAALVGFGSTALVRLVQRSAAPRAALPPGPTTTPSNGCLGDVWAPRQALTPSITLPMPAVLTVAQFPGFALAPSAQEDAMAALAQYFDAVEEAHEEDYQRLSFPGVEHSSIPPEGQEVGVQTALERIENYRRFGAAAAAAVLAPECEWPEPFSSDLPLDPKAAEVWRSLEQLAIIALAARDRVQLRVDVDPISSILDDELQGCMDPGLMHPLREPVALAPEIGEDPGDASWQMTHDAQIHAFQVLQAELVDPTATAPVTRAVIAIAPRCPWGDKARYGLDMTTMWYEVRRLEDMAYESSRGGSA